MKPIVSQVYVGVDVSKEFLDVHLYPLEKDLRIDNTEQGLSKLIKILSKHKIAQIVCESSGGYEYLMLKKLAKNNYAVWRVQAKRIRAFIVAEGIKAKTGKIDARMIALFASQKQPKHQSTNHSEDEEMLRALVKCRMDLVTNITQENNKLQHPQQRYCKEFIEQHISFMKKQLESIEKEINQIVESEAFNTKAKIIESVHRALVRLLYIR